MRILPSANCLPNKVCRPCNIAFSLDVSQNLLLNVSMPFVPGFLHDVFISYACADDQQASGLVGHFRRLLADALATEGLRPCTDEVPDGVSIFLDRRSLESGADLTQQVLTSARSSAVFIAFHSPAYMVSTWCQAEAQEFTANYDPNRHNLEGRLFVVALGKNGSPSQSLIGAVRSRRFRRFYYIHENGDDFRFEPGDERRKNEDQFTLKEEAVRMAREIAATLRAMQKGIRPACVFLMDTTPARQAQAEDIKNWLLQRNVLVLRASPSRSDWERESRELIARANLVVNIHETTSTGAAATQAKLAAELGRPRLSWLPRNELASAESEALLHSANPIEETLEDFKEALLGELVGATGSPRPPVPLNPPLDAPPPPSSMVLLIGAQKDDDCVRRLEQALDELGCGRDSFLANDTLEIPDRWRKDLQKMLKLHRPDSVVFVDGACAGAWADKRLRDLVLLLRDAAPKARPALCLFSPLPKTDRRYRPPWVQVRSFEKTKLEEIKSLL